VTVPKIRVLVVEDSLTVRTYLVDVLRADPAIDVVGEAEDGKQAIELCQTLRPDALSLDMMLPVMTGLAVTEYVMAYCPTPILIVSASLNRGEVFKTYDALNAGAVDVLDKPTGVPSDDPWEERYRQAIKRVSRIKVITHPRARLAARDTRRHHEARHCRDAVPHDVRCVAIGASTGGPAAVVELLQALPRNFPVPILLVLHIGAPFSIALSEWLDAVSPIRVRTAIHGERLPRVGEPQIIMAPPDRHLVVQGGRIWLTSEPERHHCRPSIDVLLESLATEMGNAVIGCLLTGMGRDGASGLLAIRQAGGMTIAQDEATSVVFGMPRAAIELGAARQILALADIAPVLLELIRATTG
jgi:two-component system chemotaxis response regulator CheB